MQGDKIAEWVSSDRLDHFLSTLIGDGCLIVDARRRAGGLEPRLGHHNWGVDVYEGLVDRFPRVPTFLRQTPASKFEIQVYIYVCVYICFPVF